MENDNNQNDRSRSVENIQSKEELIIGKANQFIDNTKDGLDSVNNLNGSLTNTLNTANNLVNSVNNIGNVYLESKKIAAQTKVELAKVAGEHTLRTNVINKVYDKQFSAMDKAGEVVDKGLVDNNLDMIALGLSKMTDVANHNPFANFQNSVNKELSDKFDDDDFCIEI